MATCSVEHTRRNRKPDSAIPPSVTSDRKLDDAVYDAVDIYQRRCSGEHKLGEWEGDFQKKPCGPEPVTSPAVFSFKHEDENIFYLLMAQSRCDLQAQLPLPKYTVELSRTKTPFAVIGSPNRYWESLPVSVKQCTVYRSPSQTYHLRTEKNEN